MRLTEMWQRAAALYKGLVSSYNKKGYLTAVEADNVRQLQQLFQYLQVQKSKGICMNLSF